MKIQIALNITLDVPEQDVEPLRYLIGCNIAAVMQNDGEGLAASIEQAEVTDYDFNVEVE